MSATLLFFTLLGAALIVFGIIGLLQRPITKQDIATIIETVETEGPIEGPELRAMLREKGIRLSIFRFYSVMATLEETKCLVGFLRENPDGFIRRVYHAYKF